jgi:hypothetical protein
MAQQTAVEWLYEQLFQVKSCTIQVDKPNLFQQAKAMEKEHLMMAFNDGIVNSVINKKSSEQYYNITYNK